MADYIVKLSLLSISCIFGSRFVSYLPGIIRHPCIFYKIRIGLRKQDNAPYGYAGLINETNTKQGETNVFVYITYGECPHKHVHVTSDPIHLNPIRKCCVLVCLLPLLTNSIRQQFTLSQRPRTLLTRSDEWARAAMSHRQHLPRLDI